MATLTGKKIIVVGGSSGIGFGVAVAALESGAEVTLGGRSAEKLKAAEKKLAGAGRVTCIASDMADEADVTRLFDEAGAFAHLVATAGTSPPNNPIGESRYGFRAPLRRRQARRRRDAGQACRAHAGEGRLHDLRLWHQQGPSAGPWRLGRLGDRRLFHLFSPGARAGTGPIVSPGWVARPKRAISTRWAPAIRREGSRRRQMWRPPIFT